MLEIIVFSVCVASFLLTIRAIVTSYNLAKVWLAIQKKNGLHNHAVVYTGIGYFLSQQIELKAELE